MKIFKLYFTLSAILIFSSSIAQDGQRPAFLDKIYVGGAFGASFGEYTYVNVSPTVGYMVTSRLSTGLRLIYQYRTFDYFDAQDQKLKKFSGNDFGGGPFVQFRVKGPLYLQTEYEYLNYKSLNTYGESSRLSFNSLMAGGGMAKQLNALTILYLTALYNFSIENSENSPYDSPWVIRAGIRIRITPVY